jgi:hypothetical protein
LTVKSGLSTVYSNEYEVIVDKTQPIITLTSAAFTNSQSVDLGVSITNIEYTLIGAPNAVVTGLPVGLLGVLTGGVYTISGFPTITGSYTYTVSTIGSCGTAYLTGIINVTSPLTIGSIPSSSTICSGSSITLVGPAVSGGNGSYTYEWYSSSTLGGVYSPASGINSTLNYVTDNLNTDTYFQLTVKSGLSTVVSNSVFVGVNVTTPTITLSSSAFTNKQEVCYDSFITDINYTLGGNATDANVTGLPAGFIGTFDVLTGIYRISGSSKVAGAYTYTVTTKGSCGEASATGSINVNPIITFSGSGTPPISICSGSSIIIQGDAPQGGNGTYTYEWYSKPFGGVYTPASGINSTLNYVSDKLYADTYFQLKVTSGLCSAQSSEHIVIIDQLPIASITSGIGSICSSDQYTLPNPAIVQYGTYVWIEDGTGSILPGTETSLTPTYISDLNDAGKNVTFFLKVTSNNSCGSMTDIASFVISVKPLSIATITPQSTTTFCQGGSVVLNASTGNTYEWYKDGTIINGSITDSYTATQSGSYTVKVSNGACSSISSATTITHSLLVSFTTLESYTDYHHSPITLLGTPSGGVFSGLGVSGNVFNPSIAGLGNKTITYNVSNSNNCSGSAFQSTIVNDTLGIVCTAYDTITVTDTLLITTTLGLSNQTSNTLKIYPNPAKDHITINNGNFVAMSNYTIRIDNALGQQVFFSVINQQSFFIDLSSWSGDGVYFVYLKDDQGTIKEIRKIVLQ